MPPYSRVVEPSAWAKASKISSCLLAGDADAGVRDQEAEHDGPRLLRLLLDLHHHLAVLGELDRVAHEVDEDLPQPRRVAHQALGHVGGDAPGELEPLLVGPQAQRPQRVAERLPQVELGREELEAAPPRSSRSRGCR